MINLGDLVARARTTAGNKLAVRCGDAKLTWSEAHAGMQRMAGALRGLGLKHGDRVAMISGNSINAFKFLLAVPATGAIAVPINIRLTAPEICELLLDSGARILIVETAFLELISGIRSALPQVEHFLVDGPEAPAGFQRLEALPVVAAEGESDWAADIDDVAMLLYTGGTTGRSKGVMLTHRGMITNVLQWATAFDATVDEVVLVAAPMFHAVGAANSISGAVFGNSTCLLPRFDPILFFETVQNQRPTRTSLVPTMIEMLVTHPDIGRYDLTSLKVIGYGGSPIPMRTLALARKALPGARFYQAYGQTEGGPLVTILRPEDHTEENSRIRSAGQAVSATLISIRDTQDRALPAGENGEICLRSPSIAPGYWQRPELLAETQRGGWHRTGDVGYLDKDGFLFVVDRIKDMIVTGGENVYAAEVENALGAHPQVVGCAVIGVAHERLVEQVHAVVRIAEGATVTADELIAFCRRTLAGYKCPRSIEFRREPFPMTPVGKVLKRELRKEYAERKGA